jgi:tyrosine-protein kinase Etk/Wzc
MSDNSGNSRPPGSDHESPQDGEIGLLDFLIVLARDKYLIVGLSLVAGVIAAIAALLMPNIYTASTRILPPQNTVIPSLSQVENAGALGANVPGLRNPSDLYVGMLKSRTVADNLIKKANLSTHFGHKLLSDTRGALGRATRIAAGRDGIIVIEVEDEDPQRAAMLANGYVDELLALSNVLAITAASQRRLFFERQLAITRDNLAKTEMAASQALEKGGLANVDVQSRAILETTARLRAQIAAKDIEISAMRTFATDRNPELLRAQDALLAMKRELRRTEGATGTDNGNPAPSMGLENVRLLRDVKYNEALYALLARQYELSKIDEANDAGIIQVLDQAVAPERKSRPNRTIIVLVTMLVAGVVAVVLSLAREVFRRSMGDPSQSERLRALKRALRLR